MGNHRVASAAPRAGSVNGHANGQATAATATGTGTASRFTSPSALSLRNWPVSTRLIAVIVLALLMGLIFGGLRVASAADSAEEFAHVSQLAALGQQVDVRGTPSIFVNGKVLQNRSVDGIKAQVDEELKKAKKG